MRKPLLIATFLLALTPVARADEATARFLDEAWPHAYATPLSAIGKGVGVVFSPDLSVEGNCRFYAAMGFACFQDADWNRVLEGIRNNNIFHPDAPIRTLILETHGTNGNGLKLQKSYDPKADRSYVSVGALQERLEPDGIRYIIISACNSGRLLRPSIYRALDPNNGDKLFLPATLGIVNASDDYDPTRSHIVVATPSSSHIEDTLAGKTTELAPAARRVLQHAAKLRGTTLPKEFAISDMMMEMLLRDPRLGLQTSGYVDDLSPVEQPVSVSEGLFTSFVHLVNAVAARDVQLLPPPATAHPKKAKPRPRAAARSTARSAH